MGVKIKCKIIIAQRTRLKLNDLLFEKLTPRLMSEHGHFLQFNPICKLILFKTDIKLKPKLSCLKTDNINVENFIFNI